MSEPGRYRVTLTSHNRTVARGWWHVRGTAERKFSADVGLYGSIDGMSVELAEHDGEDWRVLKTWPDGRDA
ncbi:hypothetical protein [Streptomyces sp. CC224B]|uniref:hypothetical protein n=1 Tax=Streptomyces sp. CC224B TaxID=3044571 RepID=UPI0024A93896|nr:hypothetical protein [Streptomyces sp. CC224B]